MATEDRWHDFAKEKPSEYMEGRNFIVSNGHYEKIATWCGYWENEPFMGDRLCDEVVRWKSYFTPEEEKANETTRTELKAYNVVATVDVNPEVVDSLGCTEWAGYNKDEADNVIAEKDKEIAELKQKLEDAKASAYAEMVDAGMENRKLKRALWLARAKHAQEMAWNFHEKNLVEKCAKWDNVHLMCRAKAEEYK